MRGLKSMPRHFALPADITQRQCDGPFDPLHDAGGDHLWRACRPTGQEKIAGRFADARIEILRDAILDVQDQLSTTSGGAIALRGSGPDLALGQALWSAWIGFRNRALRDMLARGELAGG
jgi:hypothetical protein